MNSEQEILEDYDLIEHWRENLQPNHSVVMPRLVEGYPPEYIKTMPQEAISLDLIELTKEHLDRMSNYEVLSWIQTQYHKVH